MFARAENKLNAGVCQTALYVTHNYVCGHFRQAFRKALYFLLVLILNQYLLIL